MKNNLVTIGYPRSGNTFLNHSFKTLYYPNQELNKYYHMAKSMDMFDFFFYPYRNPVDSIVSWTILSSISDIQMHIDFYNRMYNSVLNKSYKAEFMDFNIFTKDISYIKNKIKKVFDINSEVDTTVEIIKENMIFLGKQIHIPRNNNFEKESIKKIVLDKYSLEESYQLYQEVVYADSKGDAKIFKSDSVDI